MVPAFSLPNAKASPQNPIPPNQTTVISKTDLADKQSHAIKYMGISSVPPLNHHHTRKLNPSAAGNPSPTDSPQTPDSAIYTYLRISFSLSHHHLQTPSTHDRKYDKPSLLFSKNCGLNFEIKLFGGSVGRYCIDRGNVFASSSRSL